MVVMLLLFQVLVGAFICIQLVMNGLWLVVHMIGEDTKHTFVSRRQVVNIRAY